MEKPQRNRDAGCCPDRDWDTEVNGRRYWGNRGRLRARDKAPTREPYGSDSHKPKSREDAEAAET